MGKDTAGQSEPRSRPAHDADDIPELQRDPDDKDAKLEVELDESYPASDPPSQTQPEHDDKPPPSTNAPD